MQPHDKFALFLAGIAGCCLFVAAIGQINWDDRLRNAAIVLALIFGATGAGAWLGAQWVP